MQWKTWANLVTGLGFILIGLYVWAYTNEHGLHALLFLALAGISDLLDGYLARRLNQISSIGAILDPLRDRLLLVAILGNVLVVYSSTLIWELALIIGWFELVIMLINFIRGLPQPVHVLGKVRNAVHIGSGALLLGSYYAYPFLLKGSDDILLALMAFVSGAACVSYAFFHKKIPAL